MGFAPPTNITSAFRSERSISASDPKRLGGKQHQKVVQHLPERCRDPSIPVSAALKVDADDDDDDDDDEEDEDEGHRCFLELSLTSAQPSGWVGLPDRSRPELTAAPC